MKKITKISVLGVMASVAMISSSYGQGYINFQNTDFGALNAPVTFATSGLSGATSVTAGEAVGGEFSADLLYSINGGSTWLSDAVSASGGYPVAFFATDGDTANGAGYFQGPTVTLPQYVSGTIWFIVQAFNGSSYGQAGFWNGQSNPFSMASVATGSNPVGTFDGGSLQGFTVSVPEPATWALAGLSGLSLLAFRRKARKA